MFQHNVALEKYDLVKKENVPCFILTPEGAIRHLNDSARKLFGNYYREGQYLDMDEPSYKKWILLINNIQNATIPVISDFEMVVKNGVFYKITLQASWDSKYSQIQVCILSYDQPKIEEIDNGNLGQIRENVKISYRHLMQYVSNGIVITNPNGKIIDVNNCALVLLNKKRTDLIYEKYTELFENLHDEESSLNYYFDQIRQYDYANCTLAYKTINQKKIYLKFESMKDQSGQYLITTISDVTKNNLLKCQLEQNYTLHAVGQMAASIAHEIRNPMTSLLGFTALLKAQATAENTAYLDVIEGELHRIEDILGEMLLLSKPKQRKFESIDVTTIIHDIINIMTPHALMYNCTLHFHNSANIPCMIDVDIASIKQVFINLLKNAMEAMNNGGNIMIELFANQENYIELCITDQGTGIPEGQILKLFELFETTKENGTGLGLPYVKEIMTEHHGKIEVESKLGEGTSFTLFFPIAKESAKCAVLS